MTAPIVCVGFAEWDAEVWTNQQHLMSRLASDRTVLFVESLGLRRPQLGAGRDLRRIARRLARGLRGPRVRDGVHVLSPLVLPWHSGRVVPAINRWLLRRLVGRAVRRMALEGPILWSYVPQAAPLIGLLRPCAVVYHCVDDIAAQKGVDAVAFRGAERVFAAAADLVVASAPTLAERLADHARRVVHLPNVADTTLFATALDPGAIDTGLAALPTPRLVFTGAVVATKLDVGLLTEVARARPSWSIALVGPVGLGDPSTDLGDLRTMPNVHLLGARAHRDLPVVLRGADVALIPYARNDLTASISPMKTHEYLAAGLPVVATPLPSLLDLPDVEIAPDAESTVRAVEKVLEIDGPTARRARARRAERHSWPERVVEIETLLNELPNRRRRVIVAVTATPTRGGGAGLRLCGVLAALSRRGQVDVVFQRSHGDPAPDLVAGLPGVRWHPVDGTRGLRRAATYLRARAAGVPRGFARGVWPGLASTVTGLDDGSAYVLADGPVAGAALRGLARRRSVHYLAHNVESLLRPQIADPDAGPARRLRRFERRLLRRSAEAWVVSAADAAAAARLAPGAALRRVPNVVPVPRPERRPERTAVFVGDARYEPNRRALRFIVDELAPALEDGSPDVRVVVAGRDTDGPEFAGVDQRGFVDAPELAALYAGAGCVLVPLQQGGGSPLKLVEAMAHAVPVVATPVAVAGLDGARPGLHFLAAEPTADSVASAVLTALDPTTGERIGAAGRALVANEYSVEALDRMLPW